MMNQPPYPSSYVSAHSRAVIVKVLLIVGAIVSGLSMVVSALETVFPLSDVEEPGENLAGFAVALVSFGLALLTLAIFIATVVFFLMWLYRCYKNLPAFGTQPSSLSYSPGWAVGSFFVPFANLVIPYRAIKELWQNSVPASTSFMGTTSPPAWFPLWWFFWLLSNAASNVYFRISFNEKVSREIVTIVGVASDALSIIAAIFAIVVVGAIDRRQEEASQSLALQQFPGPPMPPPPFGTAPGS